MNCHLSPPSFADSFDGKCSRETSFFDTHGDKSLLFRFLAELFRAHAWAWSLLVVLFGTSAVFATPPNAPTNLRAVTTNSGEFGLIFEDQSTDETDFKVDYTINGNAGSFTHGSAFAGTGSEAIGLTGLYENVPYTFKISAIKNGEISASTNTINVNIAPFSAPTNPTAAIQSDGAVLVTWVDNSYMEEGYFVEYRTLPNGTFTVLDVRSAESCYVIFRRHTKIAPSTSYEFRIRGFQGPASAPTNYTSYSPVVSVTVPALTPPSSFSVTAPDETSMHFTVQGTCANNVGFEIEVSYAGQNAFSYIGEMSDDTTSVPYTLERTASNWFAPGTAYDFRLRAFYQDTFGNRTYSGYSSVASGTTPFYAPTNLVATPSATSPYHISFTWTDNSNAEAAYELQYRKQNLANPEEFFQRKIVAPNATSISDLPEFDPGSIYEFRIRALADYSASAFYPATGGVAATTKNGFNSKPYASITIGSAFSYQLSTLGRAARTDWSVGALPAGLSFDSASGIISGTITTPGVFTVPMTTHFADGSSHSQSLILRPIRMPAPPQVVTAIPTQTLTQSGSTTIALDTKFADPDTESAVRMVTSRGNLDIILYSTATPQTVANFLGYVNRGDYANTIFHRAPVDFILQGGGYRFYSEPDIFQHISTVTPVVNEPGISNVVGTLSMAKIADDPNSATSEFFFNLGDNAANLDSQDGGFTVFGRVSTASLQGALTTLADVPVGNYNVQLYTGSSSTETMTLNDMPIDTDGAPPSVISVTALPVLTYSVLTPPNSAVATATISGSSLQINAMASGSTSITLNVTDVDGNSIASTFGITVQQTLSQWAATQGLSGTQTNPTIDPDGNGLTNLHEFAFLANRTTATRAQLPTLAVRPVAQDRYAEITFPVRKFAAGLTYIVEASSTLAANDWTTLWTSTDGFAAPVVSGTVDQTDRTIVTVRDTQPTSAVSRRFLRVKIKGE